jgi:hypothetical protein
MFRNPHHFKEFKHKHLAALLAEPKSSQTSSSREQSESLKEQLKIYADIEKLLNRQQNAEQGKTVDDPSLSKSAPRKSPEKAGTKRSPEKAGTKRAHSPSSDSAATAAKKLAPNVPRDNSRIETRLEAAAPYNFLLTKIKDEPATHNDNHRYYSQQIFHKHDLVGFLS